MNNSLGKPVKMIGNYALYDEIASGGMASVHIGRFRDATGFTQTVAIKRLHPHLAKDPEFVAMFFDEARLTGRIQHPSVIQTIDVVALEGELFLVMEYVPGETFSTLMRILRKANVAIPPPIAYRVVCDTLHGLHAAHEATSEHGEPLEIVHRDVSPQNILVGVDGVARIFDFGVAKARGRSQLTRVGQVKGKLGYMAPEHFRGEVTRRTDVFAASIVLWEALTGRRLFWAPSEAEVVLLALEARIDPPSQWVPGLPPEVETVVMRGLARDPELRFATTREMALELERNSSPASSEEVKAWLTSIAPSMLAARAKKVEAAEVHTTRTDVLKVLSGSASSKTESGDAQRIAGKAADPGTKVITAPERRAVEWDPAPAVPGIRAEANPSGEHGPQGEWSVTIPGLERSWRRPAAVVSVLVAALAVAYFSLSKDDPPAQGTRVEPSHEPPRREVIPQEVPFVPADAEKAPVTTASVRPIDSAPPGRRVSLPGAPKGTTTSGGGAPWTPRAASERKKRAEDLLGRD